MEKYILAGVGTIQLLDSNNNMFLTSRTLTDSSFSISVTGEDIRGGLSNPLLGKYFHDSVMEATITDALFSLQYLATAVGGSVTIGGDSISQEQVAATTNDTLTVLGTPVAFGSAGTIGWYTPAGEENWTKITFTGKNASANGVVSGNTYCVKYVKHFDALSQFILPASIIPAECHMILTAPLFNAGSKTYTLSSQVGELVVDVPRFLLSGATDMSMTSTGASTTNLSGSALAVISAASCSDISQYATLKQIIYNQNWYDDLEAMAIDGGAEIAMTTADGAKTLKVVGIYTGGRTGIVNNANLTFTSGTTAICTVGPNTGIITPVATGTSVVSVTATERPSIDCYAKITVS